MTKEEFIESLEDIVTDEIFITSAIDLIDKEVSNNMWRISTDDDVASQLNADDLMNVTKRIKANRQEQLSKSMEEVDLIFYIWHDGQASQLRFNLINSNHKNLPFGAKISLVDSEAVVLNEFLKDDYHDGIPFTELREIKRNENGEFPPDKEVQPVVLNVYKELIKKMKDT